jgi:hypothetical protein
MAAVKQNLTIGLSLIKILDNLNRTRPRDMQRKVPGNQSVSIL